MYVPGAVPDGGTVRIVLRAVRMPVPVCSTVEVTYTPGVWTTYVPGAVPEGGIVRIVVAVSPSLGMSRVLVT